MLAAVGASMGGLFNTDPPGTAPEQASTTGMLHGFAFLLGVPGVLLAVTFLAASLWRAPAWRSARVLLAGSAAMVWVTFLIFARAMSSAMASHATGPDFAVGWQNRASVAAWAIWVALVASRARTFGQRRSAVPGGS